MIFCNDTSMPGTVLNASHVLTHLIFISTLWDRYSYYPILLLRILRPREVKYLVQGSIASKRQIQESNLGNLILNHYVDLTRKIIQCFLHCESPDVNCFRHSWIQVIKRYQLESRSAFCFPLCWLYSQRHFQRGCLFISRFTFCY